MSIPLATRAHKGLLSPSWINPKNWVPPVLACDLGLRKDKGNQKTMRDYCRECSNRIAWMGKNVTSNYSFSTAMACLRCVREPRNWLFRVYLRLLDFPRSWEHASWWALSCPRYPSNERGWRVSIIRVVSLQVLVWMVQFWHLGLCPRFGSLWSSFEFWSLVATFCSRCVRLWLKLTWNKSDWRLW